MYMIMNSSPRKDKNCDFIRDEIIRLLKNNNIEYKVYNIRDMKLEFCDDCGYCKHKLGCIKNDDFKNLYNEFNQSSGCIVISPVYFDSVPAKLKLIIDRLQAIYASKYIHNKSLIDRNKKRNGFLYAIGGSKSYETQFLGLQIPMNFFFRAINTKLISSFYYDNTDQKKIDFMRIEDSLNILLKNIEN
ncbi:MAG: flavodoxin family protein [Peptostreptococcaceae bacterium]|nr:flavodoxin family protein [Peptostreptococcaceae bacterium]